MPGLHEQLNPPRRSGRGLHPSVWRGVIVNVTESSIWVRIPTLSQDDIPATNTIPGDVRTGDRVVVAAVEGRIENLVILAKETPTLPEHKHADSDIAYPGWDVLPLSNGWGPTGSTVYFSGLRYRTDSRFVHLNGHINGGASGSVVSTLPTAARPIYRSSCAIVNDSGAATQLVVAENGAIYAGAVGPLRISVSVPLT